MPKHFKQFCLLALVFLINSFNALYANINAIDFTKINSPLSEQQRIEFLKKNVGLYDHWVHQWQSSVPKDEVYQNLSVLYSNLQKLPDLNSETYLLLGDIAHYLYNLEYEAYYQKAIDNYILAQHQDPRDYRSYWFLGNHYALATHELQAIENYHTALDYLPKIGQSLYFWNDYSIACANAGMLGSSLYAAHQASEIAGASTHLEEQMRIIYKAQVKTPAADTSISSKELWSFDGRSGRKFMVNNYVLGERFSFDSTWNAHFGDFSNKTAYASFQSPEIKVKQNSITFNILVLAKISSEHPDLKGFANMFIGKYSNVKQIDMGIESLKDGLFFEIREPSMYANVGGGHMYAMVIARDEPAFPGMRLDLPHELPKSNNGSKRLTYYRQSQRYSRLKNKLYYLILLDSCEFIHDQSLAAFKDFLQNGLILE